MVVGSMLRDETGELHHLDFLLQVALEASKEHLWLSYFVQVTSLFIMSFL